MKSIISCLALSLALASNSAFAQGISGIMDESDPVIASTIVLSTAYFIQRWEAFCQRVHPGTVPVIKAARERWLERHNALYEKADAIIDSMLSQQQRNQLTSNWRLESDRLEARLGEATRRESQEWCIETPNTFTQPILNIQDRSQVVAAIQSYQL